MKVLIAEDDAISRMILRRAVEKFGHECLVAEDGEKAWKLFQDTPEVDVIISDWMMPGIDGPEFCRRVRELSGNWYTFFIFLTALGDKEHLLEGMQAGADDYLAKPLDREQLQVRLIAASRVNSLHRQLNEQKMKLENLNRELFAASRQDPLTRLGNRLRLREDLATLSAKAERYGHSYCAILCDIDCFKAYNDHYGHLAGDDVLEKVAGVIMRNLRTGDSAYRYGGEEFLVIFARAVPRIREHRCRAPAPRHRRPRHLSRGEDAAGGRDHQPRAGRTPTGREKTGRDAPERGRRRALQGERGRPEQGRGPRGCEQSPKRTVSSSSRVSGIRRFAARRRRMW